jgi:2-polyprenyl-3-methyl-5-hydroxy-6-metoxy-1,4-benzoquinol methylase
MAALPRERFTNAFEPGCSIGVLTAELALRCDRLLATDIADRPLQIARARLAAFPQVRFEQVAVPQGWPTGVFDLVVLSEMAYYCSAEDLELLLDRVVSSLTPDGVVVACHWRHPVATYPLSGDQVHDALRRRRSLALLANHVEEDFLLQVYTRPPAVSVATAGGLVR